MSRFLILSSALIVALLPGCDSLTNSWTMSGTVAIGHETDETMRFGAFYGANHDDLPDRIPTSNSVVVVDGSEFELELDTGEINTIHNDEIILYFWEDLDDDSEYEEGERYCGCEADVGDVLYGNGNECAFVFKDTPVGVLPGSWNARNGDTAQTPLSASTLEGLKLTDFDDSWFLE